jgi:adenosyl cobinamide kinase/adenosyl cobinamide phosphate guanylyltransferase
MSDPLSDRRLILVTGGARAGKSRFAERLALDLGADDVGVVATAEALDDDMRRRIARHREVRRAGWRTVEEPLALARGIAALAPPPRVVLVDCLTLWVSNVLLGGGDDVSDAELEVRLDGSVDAILDAYDGGPSTLLLVTNEVGLGVVPPTSLGRRYRDLLGRVNQRIARRADQVYLVIAGIAVDVRALGTPI